MTKVKCSSLYGKMGGNNMPSNAEVIEMHLYHMLLETNQYGEVSWFHVLGYCLGYYETITMDHLVAIHELEKQGAITK